MAEAVETARTVGPGWPITFVAGETVEVPGDASALRQVIDNLLGNVRAHTPTGTTTQVQVGRKGRPLVLPAYDHVLKASHLFNLLDARGVISVTERAAYIGRVRTLAKACCEAWLESGQGAYTPRYG